MQKEKTAVAHTVPIYTICPAPTLYAYFLAQASRHPVVGCRRCTQLTALDLAASGDPGEYTCNIPAGITMLHRLQHLGLRHCVTGPLPRSMRQMTQLTSLDVTTHVSNSEDLLFRDLDGLVVSFVFGNAVACMHPCNVTQQFIAPHYHIGECGCRVCVCLQVAQGSSVVQVSKNCCLWCFCSRCHPRCKHWTRAWHTQKSFTS